ncbi:MAG: hypothetical protein PCFJNLEI_03253 [Verrucomicrobiae bacterium]|nr:hypothetical protein [Verrucomicrobiae bacterium]
MTLLFAEPFRHYRYALETATNGLAGGWVPVTNGVAEGTSLSLTGTVVNPQQQFWRVKGPQ